jgi:hypothetical protein
LVGPCEPAWAGVAKLPHATRTVKSNALRISSIVGQMDHGAGSSYPRLAEQLGSGCVNQEGERQPAVCHGAHETEHAEPAGSFGDKERKPFVASR